MKRLGFLLFVFGLLCTSRALAQAPIEFIENKGQWGDWIKFKAITQGGEVHLEEDGFRYLLCDAQNAAKKDSFHVGLIRTHPTMKFHVYKVTFEGCNKPQFQVLKKQATYYNYFIGNDPNKWKSNIHPGLAVEYNGLYQGVDMHVSSDKGAMDYEFFVHPHADASKIKLNFDGPEKMRIRNGNLVVFTSVGEVYEMKPYAYQYINNERVTVPCEYTLEGSRVSYDFPDGYDKSQQLIIDPAVFYGTFTGSTADNWGFTATYDESGNVYIGGLVDGLIAGTSYPVSPGAYQSVFAGGQGGSAIEYAADIGIMKFDATCSNRIYGTYIGGQNNERPFSMIVDSSDNLIIVGRTQSADYPVTTGAYQTTKGTGWDLVVTKLNNSGTGLVGSTFLGGNGDDGVNFDSTEVGYGHLKFNYGDDARSDVQVDRSGNIYATGCTESTNFPTTAGALATTLSGLQDGVVFKFNATLTNLIWSTYLGGTGDDAGYVLELNATETSFFVAGGTSSTNFPVTAGSWQTTYNGDSADGYIVKFQNSPPYAIEKATYVGTSHYDQIYGLQLDNEGNVYVMGQSVGGTFPVTSGAYVNPHSCQFVMKIDSNLTTDLISTVYGSGDSVHTNISPVAFLVDTCENVYISGWGGNLTLASAHSGFCFGMPISADAYQPTTDGADFYFVVFSPALTAVRYATYYGRNTGTIYWEGEHVDGGTSRFDKHGIIYQAICANCGGPSSSPFPIPTTATAWASVDASDNCNEAVLKIAFNIGPVTVNIVAGPSTNGCAPLTVNFTNASTNALSYVWNFGDGTTSTAFAPSHTFTAPGVYTVTISAANTNACFRTNDTQRILIYVDTNSIAPSFTYVVTDSCGPYSVVFTNTSHQGAASDTSFTTYQWFFGDATTFSGKTPPVHNYPSTGTFTVTLVMTDTASCNSPDTATAVVNIQSISVSARFSIPDTICLGTPITPLVVGAANVISEIWTFGDSSAASMAMPPTYTYGAIGAYTVTLVAQNPGACNGADTFRQQIIVLPVPTANFTYSPITPVPNEPTTFTNLSTNATSYLWAFGDNTTSTDINPVHQYNQTGTYMACLTAYNPSKCPSKICKEVSSDVMPIVGIPSGFSPNGDGQNDILYVEGAAIATLDLKIYNRWGQLVFETTSQSKGWDGTFNGQPQPIDAYAYVLIVNFIDGTAKTLKGNITLLR